MKALVSINQIIELLFYSTLTLIFNDCMICTFYQSVRSLTYLVRVDNRNTCTGCGKNIHNNRNRYLFRGYISNLSRRICAHYVIY